MARALQHLAGPDPRPIAGGRRPSAASPGGRAGNIEERAIHQEHEGPREAPRGNVRRLLIGTTGLLVVWLLMTASLAREELVAGAVVALLVALAGLPHLALTDALRLHPAAPYHLLRFLASFLLALLQSNLDMARRVLTPRLPIEPGIVEVPTGLRSRLGRLLLANSITLTPGTLTVDVEGDSLLVHWIDVGGGEDLESRARDIAGRFERHLGGFLQ